MTDRLVDIGIRRQLVADIYELRPCDDWEKDQDRLLNDDIPWLIDRVRELEAQAALDATVVEAIGPYREADSAVTRAYNRYVASKGTSEEAVAEFDLNWTRGVFVGYERVLDDALDAALAARNGE